MSDRSWWMALESKRIARMYLGLISVGALLGGVAALVMQVERWSPGLTLPSSDAYDLSVSLHGVAMVFLFLLPAVPAVLGNLVLPEKCNTKNLAWPWLNLLSFYVFLAGFLTMLLGAAFGGSDVGWTFMVPHSLVAPGPVLLWILGAAAISFSVFLMGCNLLLTMFRGKGWMTSWRDHSVLVWSLLGTALLQVIASPLFLGTMFLLVLERTIGIGWFGPQTGGDPLVYGRLFWAFGHAAITMMILPALGVLTELISHYTRQRVPGFSMLAVSSILLVVLSFLSFGHRLILGGQGPYLSILFSFFALMSLVPLGVFLIQWLTMLWRGILSLNTATLYVLFAVFSLATALLAQALLYNVGTGPYLQHTQFDVAYLHTLLLGTVGFTFLAGLYHWWPKLWGRNANEWLGVAAALLSFVFFQVTFIPMFLAGLKGLPHHSATYPEEFVVYERISAMGGFLLILALGLVGYHLVLSIFKGQKVPSL